MIVWSGASLTFRIRSRIAGPPTPMPVSINTRPSSVSASTAFTIGRRINQVRGAISWISDSSFASSMPGPSFVNRSCAIVGCVLPPKPPPRSIASMIEGFSRMSRSRIPSPALSTTTAAALSRTLFCTAWPASLRESHSPTPMPIARHTPPIRTLRIAPSLETLD